MLKFVCQENRKILLTNGASEIDRKRTSPDGGAAGVCFYGGNKAMARWLFLPNTVLADLKTLAELSDEQLNIFFNIIESDFGIDRFSIYLKIASEVGLPDQEAATLYSFWEYVQDEKTSHQKSGLDVVTDLVAYLKSRPLGDEESKDRGLDRLAREIQGKRHGIAKLFGDFSARDLARKIHALETGPLPHMSSFRTFCDLRPIFDSDSVNISDFVPSITLRIRTHGYADEHREILFLVTESSLDTLEQEISRLRRKLSGLRKRFPGLLPEAPKKPRNRRS